MKDKELRKLIGSRVKQRRLELNLTQLYVAEKMGVTASTILRYENGLIDNTKKMVLEGLSEAFHVSIEWLKGKTDEYETDNTDKKELQIRDAMGDILNPLPLDLNNLEEQCLTIRRSIRYDGSRHKNIIGPTKRKKVRIVYFGDTLTEILRNARKEQLKNRIPYGELYHKNYYREVKDKNRVYYEFYHLDGVLERV